MSALAVGLILSKPHTCILRRGDAARHAVVFQCVVSADYDLPSAYPLLRTPCKDGRKVKQASCACKTMYWFTQALEIYPASKFFAKVEDDSIVHYDGLLELLSHLEPDARIWMSLFQWCAQEQSTFRGRFCPHGSLSGRCRFPGATVTTGFASGGFDLRSRALVRMSSGCEHTSFSNFGSCDGGHGVHLAKCLHSNNKDVQLHDFVWRNWRHSWNWRSLRHNWHMPNTLVAHNVKNQSISMHWTLNMTRPPRVRRAYVERSNDGSLLMRTASPTARSKMSSYWSTKHA